MTIPTKPAYRPTTNGEGRHQYDPREGYGEFGSVQRYIKIEKVRRQIDGQQKRREIAQSYMTLPSFIKEGFSVIEPNSTYTHNWHIDAIADHLMAVTKGDIQNLIINIPPRHMKSLSVSVFWPAWTWTLLPGTQFIYASYSSGLAIRDSIKTRRLIQSEWYKIRWANIVQLRDDQNQKTRFENTEGGYRIATSVLGAATGEGGNIIVVDDPHNMKEIFSEYKRKEAITWWDTVMSTRVNNPKVDHKVIIAQRGHENDLVGHLLDKMREASKYTSGSDAVLRPEVDGADEYETLILPAEYVPRFIDYGDDISPSIGPSIGNGRDRERAPKPKTSIGFSDPREGDNELLYPDRFPRHVIDGLKKSLGKYASSAQLQQLPTPAGGAIFSIATLRCWAPVHLINHFGNARVKDSNGVEYVLPVVPLPSASETSDFQSWDFSFADFDTSSYVVGQVFRRHGSNFYLLHQSKGIRDFKGSLVAIARTTSSYPGSVTKLFELKANGFAIYSSLRDKVAGIIPITPRESKVARAQAVSPLVEAGNLIIPHPLIAPWVKDYISDLTSFPFAASDDAVDATTQALNYWSFGAQITIS